MSADGASATSGVARAAGTAKRAIKRPPWLDLTKADWPSFNWEAELAEARYGLANRPADRLRVVTWNVWFDDFYILQRHDAIMKESLVLSPDFICFQEVLPEFAKALREHAGLNELYDISPFRIEGYGVIMLASKDLRVDFGQNEFPTRMGRSLLHATAHARLPGVVVATAHLESMNSRSYRKQQLEVAANYLRGAERAVICGDFNFDDRKSWGDWQRSVPLLPPEELENHVLEEVLPDFVDTFLEFGHDEETRWTFDGTRNPVCVRDSGERMRYDRLMAKGLRAQSYRMLGEAAINDQGVRPSDHYGLTVDMAWPLV